jgi:Xaa-Pro aminopeptidase
MKTREKLSKLRQLMQKRGLSAYLVPSTDAHDNEYVPACFRRRAFMSGFTGSAGDLVVLPDKAGLWTDGRYFLQAAQQLKGSGIKLYRAGNPGVPSIAEFLKRELLEGEKLGADPRTLSLSRAESLKEVLKKTGVILKPVSQNLVDAVWDDQPAMPREEITPLPKSFSGESSASKLKRIRKVMKEQEVDAHLLTTLDSIAWTFNIRGRDVEYNPVVISYALITHKDATLFVDPRKVTTGVLSHLGRGVKVRKYESIEAALGTLSRRKARVWVDGATANSWVVELLKGARLSTRPSPVLRMKSAKNEVEIKGMKAAHIRDGVAMVRFLRWLFESVPEDGVTELSAAAKLEGFRSRGQHFRGLSFESISAYSAHGAVIHYSADEESNVPLKPKGIYLIDSGGQYLDGTTDITRTWLLGGRATPFQRHSYTRVLQGHIALARARFPRGTRGMRLDTLARMYLWEDGLDYNHGTGHGVGAYLNVHEGPQAISPTRCTGVPLEEGNVLSNEPGYYEPGKFGIRIENLVLVRKDEELSQEGESWYRFEDLTCCPLDTNLIELKLLSQTERRWINDYHAWVKKKLSKKLNKKDRRWLDRACRRI